MGKIQNSIIRFVPFDFTQHISMGVERGVLRPTGMTLEVAMKEDDPTYALGRSNEEHKRLTEQSALFRSMTERLFREAGIDQGMRVLDVGSGAGDVAFLVAELVGPKGEVVGIDLDASALELARERASLLGLSNVKFVEGDIREIELAGEFDAAVGRLVLLYFADPVGGLAAIVSRVRSGGLVVFQEMDMNPDDTRFSYPEESLWSDIARTAIQTFVGAGVHVRMGRLLLETFLGAGLPIPSLKQESAVGGGPDFPGYSWIASSMRSLTPLAEKFGIATAADLNLDSLADRIRDDAVAREAMVWSPPLVLK